MNLKDLFDKNFIFLDLEAKDRNDVIDQIAFKLKESKAIKDSDEFIKGILKREDEDSTGMGGGIAIPHILNSTVLKSRVVFVRLKKPVDWKSMDNQPVNLIFFIMTNGKDGDEHLQALGNLSSVLVKEENINIFQTENNKEKILSIFNPNKNTEIISNKTNNNYDVVGITACPTGIAHTYLAQEKLIEYANKMGYSVKIETQGRRGTENRLTQDEIDNAKVIILAHDKALTGMSRFNGKQVIETGTKEAIFKGESLINNYLNGINLKTIKTSGKDEDGGDDFSIKKFKDIKGNLLAGVSRMLPFVVGGGIILGIGFLIDFITGAKGGSSFGTNNYVAGWFSATGKLAMQMMIPVLGAYICYSIVGPQGLMPGMIAGLLSSNIMSFAYGDNGSWSNMYGRIIPGFANHESGFIGAIFGAYLAGLIVFGLTKAFSKFHKSFQGVRDIVFIPVLSLLFTGVTMFVINIPLGYVMQGISDGIQWLTEHKLILIVSALIGLMICTDMGGPINKIAYVLGTMAVAGKLIVVKDNDSNYQKIMGEQQIVMAAALLAGMMPPLMIATCTLIFPKVWTAKERDTAKVNWAMGACFVTEGAIPFMISDPKRIALSSMAGGTIMGLLVGLFKISLGAPHGGIFVFPLLKSGFNNPDYSGSISSIATGVVGAILILIVGTLLSAVILGFWKMVDIKTGKLKLDGPIYTEEKLAKIEQKLKNKKNLKTTIKKEKAIKNA